MLTDIYMKFGEDLSLNRQTPTGKTICLPILKSGNIKMLMQLKEIVKEEYLVIILG